MVNAMKSQILNELESLNPWLKNLESPIITLENYLPRKQELFLKRPEWDKLVTVLVGPRQAGKTTLGKSLCHDLIKITKRFSQLIYINCDSSIIREWLTGVYIINELRETFGVHSFVLFLDEVQRLENPGLFIKAIHDLGLPIKLIVSGSSQLEIKSKIQEYLTGRQIEALILPLSHQELPIPKHIEKNVLYGCYPQIVMQSMPRVLLSELYKNYINRDIIEFLKVGKPAVFEKLMVLIAHSSGQLLNYQQLGCDCNISGVTVKHYISILEQTYIIKTLLPWSNNKRSEVTANPKCYYLDNGFRNQALGNFSEIESRHDKGLLIESAVFQEIYKYKTQHFLDFQLHFWRTTNGAEVDFIIKQNNECFLPVEVKYQNFRQPKISRSLRSFITHFQPKQAIIITKESSEKIQIDSTEILFIPFEKISTLFELIAKMIEPYY
jgi:uncharacterized protein